MSFMKNILEYMTIYGLLTYVCQYKCLQWDQTSVGKPIGFSWKDKVSHPFRNGPEQAGVYRTALMSWRSASRCLDQAFLAFGGAGAYISILEYLRRIKTDKDRKEQPPGGGALAY